MSTSTIEFFQALYPDPVRPGQLVLRTWSRTSGKRRSHWVRTLGQAVDVIHSQRGSREACFSLALHDPNIARDVALTRWPKIQLPSVRAGFDSAVALPALWAEIELAGHFPAGARGSSRHWVAAGGALPPSRRAVFELFATIPVPPSIIVYTGSGYQAYWLLRELWLLESDADRAAAKHQLRRLQGALHAAARERGWTVAHRGELAHQLRLPDTLNLAWPLGKEITVVHFPRMKTPGAGAGGDHRYQLADFAALPKPPVEPLSEHLLRGAHDTSGATRPIELEPILAGCPWLEHCARNSHRMPLTVWKAVLRVAGRCVAGQLDGRQLAHRFSEQHPGYNPVKTEEMLAQVLRAPDPPSCRWIGGRLGAYGMLCQRCVHRGRLKSPLDLGHRQAAGRPPAGSGEPAASGPPPVDQPPVTVAPVTVAVASGSTATGSTATSAGSEQDPLHLLVSGLAELLTGLGDAATAREIVEHLARAPRGAHRQLRMALEQLFPHLQRGRLPSPLELAGRLRSHRGRVVRGAWIDRASKSFRGVCWTVRQIEQTPINTALVARKQ